MPEINNATIDEVIEIVEKSSLYNEY